LGFSGRNYKLGIKLSNSSEEDRKGASLPVLAIGIILLTYSGFAASHFFNGQWYCIPTVITIIFAIILHVLMAINTILLTVKTTIAEINKHENLKRKNCR